MLVARWLVARWLVVRWLADELSNISVVELSLEFIFLPVVSAAAVGVVVGTFLVVVSVVQDGIALVSVETECS